MLRLFYVIVSEHDHWLNLLPNRFRGYTSLVQFVHFGEGSDLAAQFILSEDNLFSNKVNHGWVVFFSVMMKRA